MALGIRVAFGIKVAARIRVAVGTRVTARIRVAIRIKARCTVALLFGLRRMLRLWSDESKTNVCMCVHVYKCCLNAVVFQ